MPLIQALVKATAQALTTAKLLLTAVPGTQKKNSVYKLDALNMLSSLEALKKTLQHTSQGALRGINTLPGTELQQTAFVYC